MIPGAEVFIHNDIPHLKIIPSKRLFNSTMVYETINRGDFFALNLHTGVFTILPRHLDPIDKKN